MKMFTWIIPPIAFSVISALVATASAQETVRGITQVSRIHGVLYRTAVEPAKLAESSGNETIPKTKDSVVITPKIPKISLSEATAKAVKYAATLLGDELEGSSPRWIVTGAKIVWLSEEQGLGYYLVTILPRTGLMEVKEGVISDQLGVVVLFSGEVLESHKTPVEEKAEE